MPLFRPALGNRVALRRLEVRGGRPSPDAGRPEPGPGLPATGGELAGNRQPDAGRAACLRAITRESDETWLAYAARLQSQPVQQVTPNELLTQVKPYLKGQVLYDPARAFTIDAATTAAGLRDAALTDKDLGLNTLYDFRTRWTSASEATDWIIKTFVKEANRRQLALLPAASSALRDYAIEQKMVTLSPDSGLTPEALQDLLVQYDSGTAVFGEATPALLPALSDGGHYLVPAQEAANLSFYSRADTGRRFYQYPGHVEAAAPRYLTLLLDCSSVNAALNVMPGLWQNPARGTLPLGWAIPASLAVSAPAVVHRYYADAYRSGNDQFVLGPSGAGFADLSHVGAPEGFYRATAKAAQALDARTCLYQAPAAREALGEAVGRLAEEGGIQGVFALASYDEPPALFHGLPTVITAYVSTVEQGVTYLNRLPLERRFAAICLNTATMTPEDAAHLAAHVSSRYVLMPPVEFMALMLSVARGEGTGKAAVQVKSVEFPEGTVSPETPVAIRAQIEPGDQVASAEVVYRAEGSRFAFSRPLTLSEGAGRADLPPLLWGGEVELKVRAVDLNGGVTWSPTWKIQVDRQDHDGDGLSDAEEAYMLTDPNQADTDGDGLTDANDPHPLTPDRAPALYVDPLSPPSDIPYLTDPADSQVAENARLVSPGKSALYRLPLNRVPPDGVAVVQLDATGPAALAVGLDPASLAPAFAGALTGPWESPSLRADQGHPDIYLRVTCPAEAKTPLTLYSVALSSAASAPSVMRITRSPLNPGPAQPITISAVAFDPHGLAEVRLNYRVNGQAVVIVPMAEQGQQQRFQATIPARDNRDQVQYWVTAENPQRKRTASVPETITVGGRGREIVALLARRNFLGQGRPSPEWGRAASYAPQPGAADTAPVNITGGTYAIWVLAAGRGNGFTVSVDGKRAGAIKPMQQDGWQQVGWVRLEAGKHHVTLTAEAAPGATPWTNPRYGAVVLSTDSTWTPPADQVVDVLNSVALLSPRLDDPLSGIVELRATGAGNITALEVSLDGKVIRRVTGPPFSLAFSTKRYANGPHTLRLEAVDRTGPTGLAVEAPITIAN